MKPVIYSQSHLNKKVTAAMKIARKQHKRARLDSWYISINPNQSSTLTVIYRIGEDDIVDSRTVDL